MGRQPCCNKVGLKKGPWTPEEDKKLINFILTDGQCCWRAVPKLAGLLRCGKSCRLRWTNYLRPDLKRGLLSEYEEKMVIDLHSQLGNRWSKIVSHLPGRTDNDIKNHWNTHIKKKLRKMGIDPLTHRPLCTVEQPLKQQKQQQIHNQQEEPQENSLMIIAMSETDQNKEPETPLQSSITEAKKVDKSMTSSFDTSMETLNNSFSTDDVPFIEPHEILVPCLPTTSTTSFSCSSNSSENSSNFLEAWQFLDFEWPACDYENNNNNNNIINNIGLWDDDFSSWDLLNNHDDGDRKPTFFDSPFNQCSIMDLDQDSWKFGLLGFEN